MESEITSTPDVSTPHTRKPTRRTKKAPKTRKTKRADRLKSVIVRFRITPEQERSVLAEYPDVRISMLARRRLLGKRTGNLEHKNLALEILSEAKSAEQVLRELHSVLDPEAKAHPFGEHLAREMTRLGTMREMIHALFVAL